MVACSEGMISICFGFLNFMTVFLIGLVEGDEGRLDTAATARLKEPSYFPSEVLEICLINDIRSVNACSKRFFQRSYFGRWF